MRRKAIGISSALVLLALVLYWPSGVFAGADAGFTMLGTVTGTTLQYTDLTCVTGQTCRYQVTAANGAGESGPSNTISITVLGAPPATKAVFGWVASVVDPGHGAPTEYRIYTGLRSQNPPTGLVGVGN